MTEYRLKRRGPAWRDTFATELRDPEEILARADTQILKKGRSGRFVGIATVANRSLAIKIFAAPDALHFPEHLLLGSPAARAARNIDLVRSRGLRAPELVAVFETGELRGKSCIVTETVAGLRADVLWQELQLTERRALALVLANFVRKLHVNGLYPQDLSVANLLVVQDPGGWEVVLVDLDRVRSYRRVSRARRVKNLVQLARTLGRRARAVEHLVFLRTYLRDAPRTELRALAREILEASRAKDRDLVHKRAAPVP